MNKKLFLIVAVLVVLTLALSTCELPDSNQPQGITLETLLGEVIGYSQPVKFSMVSYNGDNHTMEVLVDGVPYTLVEGKNEGVWDTDRVDFAWDDYGLTKFGQLHDLFSEATVQSMEEKGNDFWAFPKGGAYNRMLVLVPVDVMPKIISDVSRWDMTEAVISVWSVSPFPASRIYENVTTNEVVFGDYLYVMTYDDQHNARPLLSNGFLWGYVHVEKEDSHGDYTVYLSQSEPDFSKYPEAVELMQLAYPESANPITVDSYSGLGQVCDALSSAIYYDRANREEVKQVCGVYYIP